ncbi:MAG TPA: response regulator transcription factor [Acidimicrobiales bacterium]|nr:response regulator transcription factor [Acidimicrobiales bacterium]
MMADNPARILVVEDDQSLRGLLVAALQREGWDVRAVADAHAGEEEVQQFAPDVAILDIELGAGPDGLALARRIRAHSDVPFVFLTDRAGVEDRLAGFETGADDYLAKPFILAELLARLRVVLRRRGRMGAAEAVEIGPLRIEESGRRAFVDGELVELTRIEFELLANLAGQVGRVASKFDLLAQVWGFDGYDQNLVEVHISSLRRKLGDAGRLIQTVRGVGYVLRAT